VTQFVQGGLLCLFGLGALLYLKLAFPRCADRIAIRQYKIMRRLLGDRTAKLVQRHYVFGARLGLFIAAACFILIGVLITVGAVVPK
jgi:hypothetical protein